MSRRRKLKPIRVTREFMESASAAEIEDVIQRATIARLDQVIKREAQEFLERAMKGTGKNLPTGILNAFACNCPPRTEPIEIHGRRGRTWDGRSVDHVQGCPRGGSLGAMEPQNRSDLASS